MEHRAPLWSALAPLGLGFRDLSEDVEVELLVEAREVAIGSDGEQLIGEVHEDAIVSRGVVGEGGLELVGHQRGVASGLEQMFEAGEQLVARGIVEHEAASPARTTQSSCLASKSLLARMRSSESTGVSASWASSMSSTGRVRVEAMCSLQRVRRALKPPQRLWMASGTPKRSPSSR